jgi:hypothetical protein
MRGGNLDAPFMLNPARQWRSLVVGHSIIHRYFTMSNKQIQKFAGGEVYFWLEQDSSIHLKAVSAHGDPVELTADDAREIAAALIATAQRLDDLDSPKK